MNNRITLFLQDKDLIMELAKDPEVQLRIKDAVIDQIAKRALKFVALDAKVKKEIENTVLDTDKWTSPLRNEYKEKIRAQAREAFGDIIRDELADMRNKIHEALKVKKEDIMKAFDAYDPATIIREAAEKVVREKFK